MNIVKKDTLKGKVLNDYLLYAKFFSKVIKEFVSKNVEQGIESSNNFLGGVEQRFEHRKFECLKLVEGEHHLKWLGKQTATVVWDVGRCLVDIMELPATVLAKGAMKLSGYTPTEAGPWRRISEQSLMRQTGELVAGVGAVVWDGLLLMKCSVVTTTKLVSYLGDGIETVLHLLSDKSSKDSMKTFTTQKDRWDDQNINPIVHNVSSSHNNSRNQVITGEMLPTTGEVLSNSKNVLSRVAPAAA